VAIASGVRNFGGDHAPVGADGDEAAHEGMPLAHAPRERLQIGVLHAVETAEAREGEETLDLAGEDLVEPSCDEVGGVELALVADTAALGHVAPEPDGGGREQRQQHGQYEESEFGSNAESHALEYRSSRLV